MIYLLLIPKQVLMQKMQNILR